MGILQVIERYERKVKSLEQSNDFQIKLKRRMKLKHKKSYDFQVYLRKKYVRQIVRLRAVIKVDEKLMSKMAKENRDLQSQLNL